MSHPLKLPKKPPPKPPEPKPPSAKPPERKHFDRKPSDRKPSDRKPPDRKAPDRKPPDRKPPDRRPPDRRPPDRKPSEHRPPRPSPTAASASQDPRLSKRMSELGLCSRREADEWIENGWVRVNGEVVKTLGVRVPPDAKIEVEAAATQHQSEQVTILLNKPMGYVSGQPEDNHQPAMVLIKPENRWAEDPSRTKFVHSHLRGLAPAGRLDIDSTGLIVFTQDGRIAKRLIGQDSDVEKEYLVRVEGTLTEEQMKLLRHGMVLDDVKLKPAQVSWANEDQLRFALREGRKRQIRRMCEMVGLVVTGLKRVRTGGVPLGPLPVGQWRYLRKGEKF
ncbi:MAG TPA: pseudouridine synthase [Usitatibacter sp.]|nr:pseudouridine synthase [Usitatibacter sp.]